MAHCALSSHLVGWIFKFKKKIAQQYLFPCMNIFVLHSKNCNISKKVEPKASVAEEWGQQKKNNGEKIREKESACAGKTGS